MTIETYEQNGGFENELFCVREIGMQINELTEAIPARPHRAPEITELNNLRKALEALRSEIVRTRNV